MPPERAGSVSFRNVCVTYRIPGQALVVEALDDVTLEVKKGSFTSLIGPSGCGKSTLLRVAADLVAPTSGSVTIGDDPPSSARRQRRIGFVFQDPALLEWRTVLGNVALPLELRHMERGKREAEAHRLLSLVGLKGFEHVRPAQLSGGMRQRTAIARALSTSPHVMLMDEPFGALDQITRDRLNRELITLFEETRITVLFVTHSIREAVFLSDRVAVMSPRPGRITRLIDVDLARPRTFGVRETERFRDLVSRGARELEDGYAA